MSAHRPELGTAGVLDLRYTLTAVEGCLVRPVGGAGSERRAAGAEPLSARCERQGRGEHPRVLESLKTRAQRGVSSGAWMVRAIDTTRKIRRLRGGAAGFRREGLHRRHRFEGRPRHHVHPLLPRHPRTQRPQLVAHRRPRDARAAAGRRRGPQKGHLCSATGSTCSPWRITGRLLLPLRGGGRRGRPHGQPGVGG